MTDTKISSAGRISLPADVRNIIGRIEEAGYEAYAVGGCIRDSILGREPADWDITTSALPGDIKKIFRKTIDTGIQHGTVTVLMHGTGFEVTTYRIDGDYSDSRHPDSVTFTGNLREDLARRDFTINAMAYNDSVGLVDEFDGMGDIGRRVIRCVGDPVERFSEDALRMMRAVRFAARLGYEIDPATRDAIGQLAPTLSAVSAERIMTELTGLLMSDHPEMLGMCYELGLTAVFLPEFDVCMTTPQNNPHHCYNVGEHILHTLMGSVPDRTVRFTMMLHDIAKPATLTIDEEGITHNKGHAELGSKMARGILRRLKSDNALIDDVTILIKYHDWRLEEDKKMIRRAMNKVGTGLFPTLLNVMRADVYGQSDYLKKEKNERIEAIERLYKEILDADEAVSVRDLAINGRDLMEVGIPSGPEIGRILNAMLEHVLEYPEDNEKGRLLELLPGMKDAGVTGDGSI